MSTGSTVLLRPPAVVAELIERLQASSISGPDTLIRWGLLPKLPTEKERVYLLGVSDYLLAPTSRGHVVRSEDFGLRGLIEVQQYGTSGPEQVAGRAWELLSGLDDACLDEFGLDSGMRYSGRLAVAADEVVPMTDGWMARIIFMLSLEGAR